MAKVEMPDVLYGLLHPLNFLRVKSRQIAVSIEHEQPPVGTNFEEFPNLSVSEAAKLMGLNKKSGGVQLCDWSAADQERLKRGEKPQGHPEHLDI